MCTNRVSPFDSEPVPAFPIPSGRYTRRASIWSTRWYTRARAHRVHRPAVVHRHRPSTHKRPLNASAAVPSAFFSRSFLPSETINNDSNLQLSGGSSSSSVRSPELFLMHRSRARARAIQFRETRNRPLHATTDGDGVLPRSRLNRIGFYETICTRVVFRVFFFASLQNALLSSSSSCEQEEERTIIYYCFFFIDRALPCVRRQ